MYLKRINVPDEKTATVVYFIQRADGSGPIKIGCSSDLTNRLASLIKRRGEELVVLASAPATFGDERRLHDCFAADRSHGEWFNPSDEIAATVQEVRATGSLPEAVKCAARAARFSPSMSRIAGLDVAAGMLGSREALAEALSIAPRSLRAKLTADRGISNDDMLATADALEERAIRVRAHAAKLRAEIQS